MFVLQPCTISSEGSCILLTLHFYMCDWSHFFHCMALFVSSFWKWILKLNKSILFVLYCLMLIQKLKPIYLANRIQYAIFLWYKFQTIYLFYRCVNLHLLRSYHYWKSRSLYSLHKRLDGFASLQIILYGEWSVSVFLIQSNSITWLRVVNSVWND